MERKKPTEDQNHELLMQLGAMIALISLAGMFIDRGEDDAASKALERANFAADQISAIQRSLIVLTDDDKVVVAKMRNELQEIVDNVVRLRG